MATPVVTVASGGRPVVWTTAPTALPVTEAASGLAVTQVAAGKPGLPVTYVTAAGVIVSPFTPTTWNPADKIASVNLTNGNLTASTTVSATGVRAIAGKSSGKFYWEATMSVWANNGTNFGIAKSSVLLNSILFNQAGTVVVDKNPGGIYINGSASGSSIGIGAAGNTIGFAIDLNASLVWVRRAPSGNWNGSGAADPATGVGGLNIGPVGTPLYPIFYGNAASETCIANFGGSAFTGAVPSGFTAGWG